MFTKVFYKHNIQKQDENLALTKKNLKLSYLCLEKNEKTGFSHSRIYSYRNAETSLAQSWQYTNQEMSSWH